MEKLVVILSLLLNLYFFNVTYTSENNEQVSVTGQLSRINLQDESGERKLELEKEFIQEIITKEYDRDLVSRFIEACPSQKVLANAVGLSSSTISKLKNHFDYGKLEPSAKKVWAWIKEKNLAEIIKELGLTDTDIERMGCSLKKIDLSSKNIVYDELGKSINSEYGYLGKLYTVSNVVTSLHRMKDTFKYIDLSHNTLSDEGLLILAKELKEHQLLEEINLCDNKISDNGLGKYLINLIQLPNLKVLNISENYGTSDKTLNALCSNLEELRRKIKY